MTDAPTPDVAPEPAPRRRKGLVLVALAFITVATLWWISELYTSDAARACRDLYAGARTAADTSRIDLIVPAAARSQSEPRACVNYKR
jgi:hypothetical protein